MNVDVSLMDFPALREALDTDLRDEKKSKAGWKRAADEVAAWREERRRITAAGEITTEGAR